MRSRRNSRRFRHSAITPTLAFESLEARQLLAADIQLLKDINTLPDARGSHPGEFTQVGPITFFVAETPTRDFELWRTDGTAAGTFLVKDTEPSVDRDAIPKYLTNVNGTLFFLARDLENGYELWKSDGTLAGTKIVKDINRGTAWSFPEQFTDVNGILFFSADDGTGRDLWKSDGTEAGTVKVKDINPAIVDPGIGFGGIRLQGGFFTNVNGTLFFQANDGTSGSELWKSDGTEGGTVRVRDIRLGNQNSYPQDLTNVNGTLFFTAADSTGRELWKSDGTEAGTARVRDILAFNNRGSYPFYLTNVSGTLFFSANDGSSGVELWKSDGTPTGTTRVKDIRAAGSSAPGRFTNVNGTLYFSANDGTSGDELWKTNGTEIGTVRVKDIRVGSESSIERLSNFINMNGTLFFSANDGSSGRELWKSDGTGAGTVRVKDVLVGSAGSDPEPLHNANGILLFAAKDSRGSELWRSDGTAAGTLLVKDIRTANQDSYPRSLIELNGKVFFSANDGTSGQELWQSDGTAAGTFQFKDIRVGNGSSFPQSLINVNGTLFFSADDGTNGPELWRTDGTPGGTVLVKDLRVGSSSSYPQSLANVNGTLFFQADDGVSGTELWKSDGTAAGTVLVKDIRPGFAGTSPFSLTNVNGILFFRAFDNAGGNELWRSDGTAAGTFRVKDIFVGTASSSPASLTNVNGTLFFIAIDGVSGAELWKTDGTDAGTVRVKDITPNPPAGFFYPGNLVNLNGTLYFAADNGTNGRELWKSDGTEAGTTFVKDIRVGTADSAIKYFTNINGTLYFQANNGIHGEELWQSDGTAVGTRLVFDLAPGSGGSAPEDMVELNGKLLFSAVTEERGRELYIGSLIPTGGSGSLTIAATSADKAEGNLGNAPFTFTVTRSGNLTAQTTVNYAVFGGVANPAQASDFAGGVFPAGRVSFAANETSKVITINVLGDAVFEANEGFIVTLSGASGRATITTASATGVIRNDDVAKTLAIAATSADKAEGNSGSTAFTFSVTRSGNVAGATTVNFAVTGSGATPAQANDFVGGVFPGGQVAFAATETSKVITINVVGNAIAEANEGFTVTLSGASGGVTIATAAANGLIRNDDTALALAATSATKAEGHSGSTPFTFTVTRTGNAAGVTTVNFAVTGSGATPAQASDFAGGVFPTGQVSFAANETSKVITVNVLGDAVIEAHEGFTVTLSNPSTGATILAATASGVIQNDEKSLAIAATSANKAEGNSGTTPFTFTVTRIGNIGAPSTVNFAVTGNGTAPAQASDFLGSVFPTGQVAFAANETSKLITIPVRGDTTIEASEGFTVILSNATAGFSITTGTAAGLIQTDDISLAIAATSANKAEGNSGSTAFTFTVTRTGLLTRATTVNYAVAGSGATPATATDFVGNVLPSGVVTFAIGETSKLITINVVGDRVVEANENFVVNLSGATSGVTLATASAAGIIRNDDTAISIVATNADQFEPVAGSTPFTFTVTRTGVLTSTSSVNFAVVGSGSNPASASDFVGGRFPSGIVVFAPGETSKLITIQIASDAITEVNEGFTVNLSAPSAGVALGAASAVGVIREGCLFGGPLVVGNNILTYSCGVPGTIVAFGIGKGPGATTFAKHGMTLDISNAVIIATGIVDANGFARIVVHLTSQQLQSPLYFQAFEISPRGKKSNVFVD